MPWGDDASRFLKRVLSWPASEQDAGYGNIHYVVPNQHPKGAHSPKTFLNGKPFKSPEKAWNHISNIYTKPTTLDIYFCTSLQRETKMSRNGQYEIAHRSAENALGSKVLYIDIDVKDKGYETLDEAKKALGNFLRYWRGMPVPSALVESGGGLHCYWISNRFLPKDEWQPLANRLRAAGQEAGLRFDGGCTIDIARVLRVPETRNWKLDEPRPVKLVHLADNDLDFATTVMPALATVQVAPVLAVAKAPTSALFNPAMFPKRTLPAMYAGMEVGSEGIEPEAPILDTKEIFKQCAWLREALRSGGEHHDNPQWRLALVASTFLSNADTVARKLSDRHPNFSEEEFAREWPRAKNDVKAMNMGYPSCASIEQNGSKECAGCPLRGKIRSPLNTGIVRKSPAAVTSDKIALKTHIPTTAQPFDPAYLPENHVFNEDGIPCFVHTQKEKTADGETENVQVLLPMFYKQRIYAPFAQETPTLAIGFEVDGNLGVMRRVFLDRGVAASPGKALEVLSQQGVASHRGTSMKLGVFFMELARQIEMLRRSINAKPAGWVSEDGERNGFAYGGVTYKSDGTTEPSGFLDEKMREKFQPIGTAEAWMTAAQWVVDQQRQEFCVMLASVFGAPLMVLTGQALGCLMAAGKTGCGKTTIMKIAQAVWGHPERAPLSNKPTGNALPHIMGVLANLPVIWDDITEGPPQETLAGTIMMNGKERERLVSKYNTLMVREQGSWDTILMASSNHSFIDFLAGKGNADTGAARMRVFELPWIEKRESKFSQWDIDQLLIPLRKNHGVIGQQYAKFLAEKSAELPDMLIARGREFDKLVTADHDERFWSYFCACTLLGAEFAKELGFVDFDLDAMRTYLVDAFTKLRARVSDELQTGHELAVQTITGFIKDNANRVLITDSVPEGRGKSSKPINVLKQPSPQYSKGGVVVQFVDREFNPVCRIDRTVLHDWMNYKKISMHTIYGGLEDKHEVTNKLSLGAGTIHVCGRERVLEIEIAPGSWLEDTMRNMRGHRSSDDEPTPPPVTGLVTGEANVLADAEIAKTKDAA